MNLMRLRGGVCCVCGCVRCFYFFFFLDCFAFPPIASCQHEPGATQRRCMNVERRVWRAWLSADCLGQLLRTHSPALPPTTTTFRPCGLSWSACTICPPGHFHSHSPAHSAYMRIRVRGIACLCPSAAGGRPVCSVRWLQGVGARARAGCAGRFYLGSSPNVD
eukprot:COSAG01_NODE_1194_length_11305_cov_4.495806_3_plen_163_part_00